ncbi:MAG: hypothetical protein AB7N76_03700 [Planctomycetota bacterium]
MEAHDIHAKAVGQRGLLQKIGNFVPGFRGYQKREEWREVDQIQRTWCAEKLSGSKEKVKRALNDVIAGGDLDGITPYEKLMSRLDTVANKVKNADRGWSGMFDTIKVGEEQLEKVYQFDLSMAEGVSEVETKIGQLNGADKSAALGLVREATDLVDKLEDYFARREEIMRKG